MHGKILQIIFKLEKHFQTLQNEPFALALELADQAKQDFHYHCDMMRTDLYHVGALLNPYLLHNKELANDGNGIIACKQVFWRLALEEKYSLVVEEFLAFWHKLFLFHDMITSRKIVF